MSTTNRIDTPALIYNENKILESIKTIAHIGNLSHTRVLYSLKPFVFSEVLNIIVPMVNGFSASSLFEATLARDVIKKRGTVHLVASAIRSDEIDDLAELCDYISFNSFSQWEKYHEVNKGTSQFGLRINPQLKFIEDDRYNPSRKYSKLGIPLDRFVSILNSGNKADFDGVSGIHFHNNCDSTDFGELLQTVKHIANKIGGYLHDIEWINLGGGYLFDKTDNLEPFHEAVNLLTSKYNLDVFIEPGASIVRDAGYIVSSVLDMFESDGKTVVILDTTVNHMPEVFEYQFEPDVMGHVNDAPHQYILAGCSCLSGDLFGEYAFEKPLNIGSRIVFLGMGAYTLVKANMFNGINLPTIYALTESGELVLKKQFTYEDFASRCGVDKDVPS